MVDKALSEVTCKLPKNLAEKMNKIKHTNLQEIRFRTSCPVMLYYSDRKSYLGNAGECACSEAMICSSRDIEEIVANFCEHSVYAYTENIKEGFITLPGGHRVGIGGRAVGNSEEVLNLTDFSSVNIRIAREYKDSAKDVADIIQDGERIYNTLIIAPPGAGKTTLLRDIARRISENFKVTIIDERFEIAAQRQGVAQFDVGMQTDILSGISKTNGIRHALRSLSPDVIVCDEIGNKEDLVSVENILKGGCKIITTMHGYSIEEAQKKWHEMISLFEVLVLMHKENGKPEVVKCLKF